MGFDQGPKAEALSGYLEVNDHIRGAIEAANVALWSYCPDTGDTWFSDTWFTLLNYAPGEIPASFDTFMELLHPDDHETVLASFNRLLDGLAPHYRADFRLKCAQGHWRWLSASGAKVHRDPGTPEIVYGMQMDISDRKKAEIDQSKAAALAELNQRRLQRIAENSPAALYEFRIDTEGMVTLPYITAGVHEMLNVPPQDVQDDGTNIFRNIFEEDVTAMGPEIEKSRATMLPFKFRYRVKRSDKPNGFIWVQANSVPHREADGSTSWFGSVYDITAEVEREAMLADARDSMQHLALHDGLTGLPNRRKLDAILQERSDSDRRCDAATYIIRIDLDRFKYVNDTMGHAAGDAVLVHVSNVVKAAIGDGDSAARMGGDEFCIVMAQGRTLDDATAVVYEIQDRLSTPMLFEGKPCRFGASFGVASSEHGDIESGDLMSFADAALYEAKAAGRGRMEVFDSQLHDTILQGRRLATELENALEKREFEPFLQPQICAYTGQLMGAEVLSRWRKSDGKIVTPDKFLPIAEQIRAVPLIDKAMVEETHAVLEGWLSSGFRLPRVSFNVSAGRLKEPSLVESVRPIQDLGITVAFELVESILLEEADTAMQYNIDLAREFGIEIEVDDFGSAHSSILGLISTSPDMLKIDRRLTMNVEDTDQAQDVISSIVALARTQNIGILAEGIETQAQAEILRDLGCSVLQGFHYAPPLDATDFLDWAQSRDGAFRSRVS